MDSRRIQIAEVSVAPEAVVCSRGLFVSGEIMIGRGTIIHPNVTILAEAGPIYIGEGNVIEEKCVLINRSPAAPPGTVKRAIDMTIGNHNIFSVGSYSEALKIGNNNLLEQRARLGRNVVLTNGCTIGMGCALITDEILPENTTIINDRHQRMIDLEQTPKLSKDTLQYLSNLLSTQNPILSYGMNHIDPRSLV